MKTLSRIIGVLVLVILISIVGARLLLFPIDQKETIKKYAKEYNVKPEVIAAVIHFETEFKPSEYKEGKKVGLMNIRDSVGVKLSKEMGQEVSNPKQISEADTNIKIGTWYISKNGGDSDLSEMMGKWVLINEEKEDSKMIEYAKTYYGEKIKKRANIYKILYPEL